MVPFTGACQDDPGFSTVADRVHVNDLHATMPGLPGVRHAELTCHFEGLDHRLTDVRGDNNLASRLSQGFEFPNL